MAGVKSDQGRARRVAAYQFVAEYLKKNKYPPMTKDICKAVGMPYTTGLWHLQSLREQGYLLYEDGAIGRTMRLGRKRNVEGIE